MGAVARDTVRVILQNFASSNSSWAFAIPHLVSRQTSESSCGQALPLLKKAATLRPGNARFHYVYAVALRESAESPPSSQGIPNAWGAINLGQPCLVLAVSTPTRPAVA